ncbi:MAG: hypothetical protein ACRDIV_17850 [Ktedonobacteraceae bacterium]
MLQKGYYLTKGGYSARLDTEIVTEGIGVVREVGYVAYKANGEFAYKDEPYEPHPGESLDLLLESWQSHPFHHVQRGGE